MTLVCGHYTVCFVLCGVLLAGCSQPEADSIFGRGGKTQWIDVPQGRLKADVYSTTPLSAHPVLVIVLHGDLFNPTPSYQYAFAQALTQGFDAPVMPDSVRARLGRHPDVNDVVAAGLLRPGYTDNAGDNSDGQRGDARGDNFTAEVTDAVTTAVRTLKERYMARRVVMVGHSGGATIAAIVLGRHPQVVDAARAGSQHHVHAASIRRDRGSAERVLNVAKLSRRASFKAVCRLFASFTKS